MKNECLWGIDIEFKMFMRKVKSLLKQTTPLQICTAPFLNSPEPSEADFNQLVKYESDYDCIEVDSAD